MLNDRIQVIDWLENILPAVGKMHSPFYSDSEMQNLAGDAMELVIKQESKSMKEDENGWHCPSCRLKLIGKTASGYPCNLIDLPDDEIVKFCPECGQAVKWDD